jgi:hypothetical protein
MAECQIMMEKKKKIKLFVEMSILRRSVSTARSDVYDSYWETKCNFAQICINFNINNKLLPMVT